MKQIPPCRLFPRAAFLALAIAAGGGVPPLGGQQQGAIVGMVVDEVTGVALEGAKVTLGGHHLEASTDTDGLFELPAVPNGVLAARVELAGYATVVEKIEVPPDEVVYFRFVVSPLAVAIQGILVALRPRTAQGGALVKARPTPRLQTALDLLREGVPGVRVRPSDNGGRLRIRSSSSLVSNDPAVFLDGVLIGSGVGSSAIDALQRISAQDVLRIRVLHGPSASALYGDSTSGVILVETR